MKNNKIAVFLLIPVIIIQLLIPVGFILEKEAIIFFGEEYKFEVNHMSAKNDSKLFLSYNIPYNDDNENFRYAVFAESPEGICVINILCSDKPDTEKYLKSVSSFRFENPLSEYALSEPVAEKIQQAMFGAYLSKTKFYATAKVLNGKALVTGVFCEDGTPVEEKYK